MIRKNITLARNLNKNLKERKKKTEKSVKIDCTKLGKQDTNTHSQTHKTKTQRNILKRVIFSLK